MLHAFGRLVGRLFKSKNWDDKTTSKNSQKFELTGQPITEIEAIRRRAEAETPNEREKRLGTPRAQSEFFPDRPLWAGPQNIKCPVCLIVLRAVIPSDDPEPYQHNSLFRLVAKGTCPKCEIALASVINKDDKLSTRDLEYDKMLAKYSQEKSALQKKTRDIKKRIKKTTDEDSLADLDEELFEAEADLEQLEEDFDDEKNYYKDNYQQIRTLP